MFMFATIFLAVIFMVITITKFKQHPFLVLIITAVLVGIANGIPVKDIISTVKSGFGNILASIGIVILAGTMIGTILEKTGAALTMANSILKFVGKKNSVLTMGITGYVTGIPVFCDSGFVILNPIARTLASRSNVSLAVMATALSGGLYATHCLVPPTPGPIVMAGTLGADLGLTILVGLAISIPVALIAILYAVKVASKIDIPANPENTIEELLEKYGNLPSALHSFSPILLPIGLIALQSIANFPSAPFGDGMIKTILGFLGEPMVALILGVFVAMTLIPSSEKENSLKWLSEGVTNSASILAITGAGGSFGAILQKLPIADTLSGSILDLGVGVLLPFIIAALLKTAMGSSTVAMITTSAMIAPMVVALGFGSDLGRTLVLMAIGAGSMTVSHANDSYFWVVSQFSDMDTKAAYKCQTGVTAVMGFSTIIMVAILAMIFV
ncbi:gluconate transporter [Candidatus Epulonipiscium fishelsonii]|uniref:Gluconate transporter n=1 Tax=Candidatus Epulonipiscium fishelsonii TaxID=77094 RepID=A0ACC8XEI7_9FIRM|nr:gluconate transporter [Epulopiscium sp. SCG-B11WGA-EpuloA1]ONI43721.1 gluconate transporter [Epulopiscium sp. SCG-B05WGA-EpuloA1]